VLKQRQEVEKGMGALKSFMENQIQRFAEENNGSSHDN